MKQGPTGLQAKLASTAAVASLLATDPDTAAPRIQEGWPEEMGEEATPQPGAFPLLTYELAGIKPIADGVAEMTGQIHVFTWYQQRDQLDGIEREIRRRIDQAAWNHDGARLHATLGVSVDDPARKADEPEHRAITVSLLVSEE